MIDQLEIRKDSTLKKTLVTGEEEEEEEIDEEDLKWI